MKHSGTQDETSTAAVEQCETALYAHLLFTVLQWKNNSKSSHPFPRNAFDQRLKLERDFEDRMRRRRSFQRLADRRGDMERNSDNRFRETKVARVR